MAAIQIPVEVDWGEIIKITEEKETPSLLMLETPSGLISSSIPPVQCACKGWLQTKNICKCLSMLIIQEKKQSRTDTVVRAPNKRSWLVRNSGKTTWPACGELGLVCLNAPCTVMKSFTLPRDPIKRGETVQISIRLDTASLQSSSPPLLVFQLTRMVPQKDGSCIIARFGERINWNYKAE